MTSQMLINTSTSIGGRSEKNVDSKSEPGEKRTIGGALSSCTAGMKVCICHRSTTTLSAMDHVEVNSHTRGSMMMVMANIRFVGTGSTEGKLLSMIGWGKELTHKNNLKKKPTIVYPMNNPWYVTMSTATTLRITPDGVLGD